MSKPKIAADLGTILFPVARDATEQELIDAGDELSRLCIAIRAAEDKIDAIKKDAQERIKLLKDTIETEKPHLMAYTEIYETRQVKEPKLCQQVYDQEQGVIKVVYEGAVLEERVPSDKELAGLSMAPMFQGEYQDDDTVVVQLKAK